MEQTLKTPRLLWDLFWSFLKISPMSFGGGYAMLPAIEREAVVYRGWISELEMAETISIAGAAPGGIGVNAAAFIGYKVKGWSGMVAAVAGIILPTFLIVVGLGIFFAGMREDPKAMAALKGIQISIMALIAYIGLKMVRSSIMDKTTLFLFIICLSALLFLGLNPIFLLPFGAATGVLLVRIKDRSGFSFPGQHLEKIASNESVGLKPKFPDYYFGDGI